MSLEIIHRSASKTKGQSLLFVHGMWHGAWCWDVHFLPFFAELGYSTYAFSLRNHGNSESEKGIWRVRIKDYVEDLRQAVLSIDSDPILIGHSMGGFVIQKYLEQYTAPAVVLLTSVPPYGIIGPTWNVLKKMPLSFFKANLSINLTHIITDIKNASWLFFSDSLHLSERQSYHSKLQNEAYLAYIDMMLLDLVKVDKIDPPRMLVLGAEDDKVISKVDVERTAISYDAVSAMIPNIAHDVMLDTHWKLVAEKIEWWLSTNKA